MKYGLHGNLKAKSGKGPELMEILLQASEQLRDARGCYIYLVSIDPDDNDCIWVTEVWETKEDHDGSLLMSSVRALIMKAMPLLDGMPQGGSHFNVIGGLGI